MWLLLVPSGPTGSCPSPPVQRGRRPTSEASSQAGLSPARTCLCSIWRRGAAREEKDRQRPVRAKEQGPPAGGLGLLWQRGAGDGTGPMGREYEESQRGVSKERRTWSSGRESVYEEESSGHACAGKPVRLSGHGPSCPGKRRSLPHSAREAELQDLQ